MFRILYRRESINHIQSIKTAYIRKTDTRMQLFVFFINWPSTLGLISDIYSVNSHSFGWVSWTEWVIGSDINTTFSMYTCATFKQAVWAYIECTHLSTSATGLRMVTFWYIGMASSQNEFSHEFPDYVSLRHLVYDTQD